MFERLKAAYHCIMGHAVMYKVKPSVKLPNFTTITGLEVKDVFVEFAPETMVKDSILEWTVNQVSENLWIESGI